MSSSSAAMRGARWVAVLVIVTIGVAAFALSFAALKELAIMARTPPELAWLWPVIVDGTIIQATISMLVLASGPERRWFLGVLVCGALVSVVGNSVHAAMAGEHLPWWAAALVAAVAPVSLLVDTHGLAMLFRASQRPTTVSAPEVPEPVPAAEVVPESRPADSGPPPKAAPARRRKPAARRDPTKVARAIAMHGEGKSYPEIAAALGVSASTARNYVGTADTPAPAPAVVPAPAVEPVPVRLAPVAAPPAPVRPAVPPRAVAQPMLPLAVAARG